MVDTIDLCIIVFRVERNWELRTPEERVERDSSNVRKSEINLFSAFHDLCLRDPSLK